MIDEYVRILAAAAETEDEAIATKAVAKLVEHLEANGRIKMLSQIARELELVKRRRESLKPLVEVARNEDAQEALAGAKEAGIEVKTAVVNDSLIRGWRARAKGVVIDRSAKRALVDIYQKVTA